MPKSFVGEPFCALFQKISDSEKVYGLEGGGSIKIFRRKFLFVSQCRKFPWVESFSVSLILGIGRVRIGGGGIKHFHRNLFVSQRRKIFVGEAFCV